MRWARVIALAVLIALSGAPVAAHGLCGSRASFVTQLLQRYGETRQGGRLPGSIMYRELYANAATGSWTILRAHPPDLSCVERSGIGFVGDRERPREKES